MLVGILTIREAGFPFNRTRKNIVSYVSRAGQIKTHKAAVNIRDIDPGKNLVRAEY